MEYYIYKGEDELYHWGIKGMKWGVRRFQNKDGSLTPAGEKRRAKLEGKLEKLKGGGKKNPDSEPETESVEAKKERILQSRSAKEIYKNANLFSTQELQAAKTRLMLEQDIARLAPAEVDKGKQFANDLADRVGTMTSIISSGSSAWNSIAKVYNSLYGNKNGAAMPTISDKVTSELDRYKNETEWLKAKNERKKAEEEAAPKKKTKLEELREETALIDADNKNREAKRARKRHDESDAKEAAKAAEAKAKVEADKKARKEAEKAEAKAEKEAKKAEVKAEKEAKKADAKAEKEAKSDHNDNVFEGEVVGSGHDKSSNKTETSSRSSKTTIDAEWWEVVSDSPYTSLSKISSDYSAGKAVVSNYLSAPISGLLSAPKDDD